MIQPRSAAPAVVLGALALALATADVRAEDEPSLLQTVRMSDVEVISTSGTLVTRHILAESSRMAEDSQSLLGENVRMRVRAAADAEEVTATSPSMRYYLSGAHRQGEAVMIGMPDAAAVEAWSAEIAGQPGVPALKDPVDGDLLLGGEPGKRQVLLGFETNGRLETEVLLVSRQTDGMVALGSFEQTAESENGGLLSVRGAAFATDRAFGEWHYFVVGDTPVQIEYQGAAQ